MDNLSDAGKADTDSLANIDNQVYPKKMEVLLPQGMDNLSDAGKADTDGLANIDNQAIALESVKTDGLQPERELVLAAVQENGIALQFASGGLRADRQVVLTAVRQNGAALEFAAEHIRADREVVLAAMAQDPDALKFAQESLRSQLHVERDFAMVARLLLARGRAHVDARDALGRTPLCLAAGRGHTSSGRTLMYFGATVDAKASDGLTPLQAAKEQSGSKLAAFIEKHSKLMRKRSDEAGVVRKKSHIVAPKLVMTPVGYCPEDENGKVIQLKRGIRYNKRRQGPSSPKCIVNWYSPRG